MGRFHVRITAVLGSTLLFAAPSIGCKREQPTSEAPASSEVIPWRDTPAKPEPTISSAPIPIKEAEAILNPNNLPAYSGPVGTVEGVIRIKGDSPPQVPLNLPAGCMLAEGTYGRLFREGKDRVVADVLVAVTGYEAYLPEKKPVQSVNIEGCAFSGRTFAMTFGQRMEVQNLDKQFSYIPVLHGSRFTAYSVAISLGDPVKLYPHRVGQYQLADNMKRPWMSADVFVLKYSTHDVTDIEGKYRIEGVPVGEMHINALLPVVDLTEEKPVTIKEGEVVTVDFELVFDQKKVEAKTPAAASSPAPSSSVPQLPMVK
jgi:hypothetical protein